MTADLETCVLFLTSLLTLCSFTTQVEIAEDYYVAAVVDYAPPFDPTLDGEDNILNPDKYAEYMHLAAQHQVKVTEDYYVAAVVEYAPPYNPTLDGEENILNNAAKYAEYMHLAAQHQVDIIVFPEASLKGYSNMRYYTEVPRADDKVIPCNNTSYSAVMSKLSCAAVANNMYVVVNLPEKSFNSTLNQTLNYNTNVVFDRSGMVVARYRKYHLFGEYGTSVPDLEYVYFDTDFGVRFGVFICFDMEFKDPAVALAREFKINHLIFSTAWFSELPFLSAIQAQWSYAYTLDVVLLAAGYNDPNVGSTGSGIYHGRNGPHSYRMVETCESTMLISTVLKANFSGPNNIPLPNCSPEICAKENEVLIMLEPSSDESKTKLKMLQDTVGVYETELLFSEDCSTQSCVQDETTPVSVFSNTETLICHKSVCCLFKINMTTIYDKTPNLTKRGDDYNQLYYRLATFEGVRTYANYASGGLQLCSIIACVNETLEGCGIRSDIENLKPRTINDKTFGTFYQSRVIFHHVEIHADFNYIPHDSFIYPDVLVSGTNENYGSLVSSDKIDYRTFDYYNGTIHCELETSWIENVITIGIYGRMYDRDGQEPTKRNSSSSTFNYSLIFLTVPLIILWKSHILLN
uniref:CN hydrolase domain-containing protein n=1 Tax=Clastoptera arizonana TaxID=38151 RepID=A0A1B6CW57_9HEMI